MMKFSRLPISLLALTFAAPVLAAEPAATMAPQPTTPSVTHPAAVTSSAASVDINTATAGDLKALPGVSDAEAAKIVQGRPYKAANDLVAKKIMSDAEFAKIKDRLVVSQPKS